MGSIPGLDRSPGRGSGNSLQYPCLEKFHGRRSLRATVHGVTGLWPQHNILGSTVQPITDGMFLGGAQNSCLGQRSVEQSTWSHAYTMFALSLSVPPPPRLQTEDEGTHLPHPPCRAEVKTKWVKTYEALGTVRGTYSVSVNWTINYLYCYLCLLRHDFYAYKEFLCQKAII